MAASALQRVLEDPVEAEVDPGRQRSRLTFHPQLDRLTALARALDQGVDLGDARLRLAPSSIVAVTQDSEDPAHLRESLATGVLDRAHRDVSSLRVVGEEAAGALGLNDHARNAPRHDRVQLARDSRTLTDDGQLRSVLALSHKPR